MRNWINIQRHWGSERTISIYHHKAIVIFSMHKIARAGELFLAFENGFSAPSTQSAPWSFYSLISAFEEKALSLLAIPPIALRIHLNIFLYRSSPNYQ